MLEKLIPGRPSQKLSVCPSDTIICHQHLWLNCWLHCEHSPLVRFLGKFHNYTFTSKAVGFNPTSLMNDTQSLVKRVNSALFFRVQELLKVLCLDGAHTLKYFLLINLPIYVCSHFFSAFQVALFLIHSLDLLSAVFLFLCSSASSHSNFLSKLPILKHHLFVASFIFTFEKIFQILG